MRRGCNNGAGLVLVFLRACPVLVEVISCTVLRMGLCVERDVVLLCILMHFYPVSKDMLFLCWGCLYDVRMYLQPDSIIVVIISTLIMESCYCSDWKNVCTMLHPVT